MISSEDYAPPTQLEKINPVVIQTLAFSDDQQRHHFTLDLEEQKLSERPQTTFPVKNTQTHNPEVSEKEA